MSNPWDNDSCENIRAYYEYYSIPQVAALWCGVPIEQVDTELSKCEETSRGILKHPHIPCIEPRCRVLHDAINAGKLRVRREHGRVAGPGDHVAYERRHVSRNDLKDWMKEELPSDKPAFLFDDVERDTHESISKDSYLALKVKAERLESQLLDAKDKVKYLNEKLTTIEHENKSLKNIVGNLQQDSKENPKSINSLMMMNISMAVKGYGYDTTAAKSAIPKEIAADVNEVTGENIDTETVKNWLKKGAQTYNVNCKTEA